MTASGLVLQLTPLALATVISPIVFISLFVVLQTDRAVRNGWIFVLGLVLAVGVVEVLSAFLVNSHVDRGGTTDDGISWFNLVLGIGELTAGIWLLWKGPKPGEAKPPKFLDRLHDAKWPVILIIGIAVPTYPAVISAGTALLRSNEGTGGRWLSVIVYLLLCALIVSVPVIIVAWRGQEGRDQIRRASDWLVQHSKSVGSTVLIIVGVYLIVTSVWTAG